MSRSLGGLRVVLIGGTSHTGKSTVASALAARLGWPVQSTDHLARHPGRPWRDGGEPVPAHVAEHYLTLELEELMADVLRHYRVNVWPQVEDLIASHRDDGVGGLVLEGSALWPEWVAGLDDAVRALWLTADHDLIRGRMLRESRYGERTPRGQRMIDAFLRRTLAFDERLMAIVRRRGLPYLPVDRAPSLAGLCDCCLDVLADASASHP